MCHQNLFVIVIVVVDVPSVIFHELDEAKVRNLIRGLEKASGALVKCIYAEFCEESRGNEERL